MKRLLLLLAALALATPAAAQRELTVVAVGGALQDHMRRTLFESFTRATGIPLRDAAFDANVGPIRAMVQARNVTWDVVMVEAPDLIRGCEDGIFERVDWSVIRRDKFLPRRHHYLRRGRDRLGRSGLLGRGAAASGAGQLPGALGRRALPRPPHAPPRRAHHA